MEDLLTLPGVGRKTANVILGDAFGIPGIVVDTHAKRLSNRIGLVNTDDPKKIEFELMEIVPKEKWSLFCHQLSTMEGRFARQESLNAINAQLLTIVTMVKSI